MEKETIPSILSALKNTTTYHGQTDYYIKKSIGEKYNLKTVKKDDLIYQNK